MTSLSFVQDLFKDRRYWRVVGILTIDADGIAIEWRSDEYQRPWGKARMQHVARGEIQNAMIPWTSIDRVTYTGRFFGPGDIRIHARNLAALDALPGAVGAIWSARVSRPDRERAREFVLASEGVSSNAARSLDGPRRQDRGPRSLT